MRKRLITATVLLSLLFVSSYGFAQVNAVLSGTVADASGALIPGVEVTAKNINTGITDTRITNETGSFAFPSLQPGKYTLSAMLSGFKTAKYDNVDLGSGQNVRLNFALQVGAAAQNVEVTIAADTLLATTSASVGNVINTSDALALPLSTRNVLDTVATTAGIVLTPNVFGGAPVANFGGMGIGAINTTRDGLVTNDGRYNNSNGMYSGIFTSPDMVEEVRVSSNNVDPTLGRGGAQVQMRTRSGTNEFHGAGFYSNNNSVLNAQTYFQNLQNAGKNYANRNQYGARVGGPVLKNKLFFFVLTDNQRYLDKATVNALVLTDTARQGIFRYSTDHRNGAANSTTPSVDTLGNPLNPGAIRSFNVFSDVKDPNRTGIDQTWVAPQYLTRMPHANNFQTGGGLTSADGLNTGIYQWLRADQGLDGSTGSSPNTNRNHLTIRSDYQVNSKNKIAFSMTREKDWGVSQQTGLPDYPAGQFGDIIRLPYFYTSQWTYTVSPTVLNEFRLGKKRDTWLGTSGLDKGCCIGAGENTRTTASQELYDSFPQVANSFVYAANPMGLGNYVQFNVASPRLTYSPYTQISDTISFTKGAHSFSVGFDMDWAGSHGINSGNALTTRPNANLGINSGFPSLITAAQPYATGINASDITTASNLLATLAGSINNITQTFYIADPKQTTWTDYTKDFLFDRYQHQNDWDFFLKDNWKASKNLTLILGLRYDKYGVPYDSLGFGGRFVSANGGGQAALFGCSGSNFGAMWSPGAGNCGGASPTLTGAEFVGKNSSQPDKLIHNNDWKDFGPSLGFSYAVPGTRNTVIRGGYGINYSAASDFLQYSGDFGSFPGNSLNITQNVFSTVAGGYMDLARIKTNQSVFPLSTTGVLPFQPVPLNLQSGGSRATGITAYADDYKAPYIQSFNLSIQRELTRGLSFDIGWVGNKSSRGFFSHALNDVNVQENGILDAFNAVRAGQESPLLDKIFNGANLSGKVVGATDSFGLITAARALRNSTTTNGFLANGNVGGFANFINTNATLLPAGNINAGKPGGLLLNAGLPQNFIVVSPQFSSVTLRDNSGSSDYHSLQTHVTKRAGGLTGQFSYTLSKAIGTGAVRDQRNFQISKGLLSVDRTHVLVANATYDLPFGKNHLFLANAPSWAQRVIEGWRISSNSNWTSGAPLSFTLTGVGTLYNTATNTANQVGPMPQGKIVQGNGYVSYFDTLKVCTIKDCPNIAPNFGTMAGETTNVLGGVFTNQVLTDSSGNIIMQNPTPGTIGTMAANSPTIKGPGQFYMNGAIQKTIRIGETRTFSIRADAVNVLNRPVWGTPNTNFNGANFGRITSAGGNRTVTLEGRLDF
jgi:hypothetical protein